MEFYDFDNLRMRKFVESFLQILFDRKLWKNVEIYLMRRVKILSKMK